MMQFSDKSTESETVDQTAPDQEGKYHSYTGRRIPWYVRAIWLGFWIFALYYVITYLFPNLQVEIVAPP